MGLAVVALNVLTQLAMFALPNFDGNNLLIAAVLLLLAVVLGLILTGKLGLWKGEQNGDGCEYWFCSPSLLSLWSV